MQSSYPAVFDRDMACTPTEWMRWLPQAMGESPWTLELADAAPHATGGALTAQVAQGSLRVSWQVSEPRRLGLAVIPRLAVRFAFSDVHDEQRALFMKRFDLYTQRGGG